jgi:mRNA interferase RelE/StbE
LAWRIEISKTAEKQLEKMDREVARRIAIFLRRLKMQDDPRAIGAALKVSELGEFRKYRVGDWRLICQIHDNRITIEVLRFGNRREVYR